MYDVFISYSSTDQKVVEALSHYLEERGVRCFVAYRDIPPGTVWAGAITQAIEKCQLMVIVFSKDFNVSVQVDREIELCAEEKKPILTFRIQNEAFIGVKKYYLKNLNWIDAFPNPADCFQSLYESVTKLLKTEPIKISLESITLIEENQLQKEREDLERLKNQLEDNKLRQELARLKSEKDLLQQELNDSREVQGTVKKDDKHDLQIISVSKSSKVKLDNTSKNLNITETVNGVNFDMIFVKGGTFLMGSPPIEKERSSDEQQHSVKLHDFYIGKTVVTQALWETIMGSNPSYFKGENRPVENVSWNDCQKFITILNHLTGKGYRLPTEAEWEYAARGGSHSKSYKYSGSNSLDKVAWYDNNCDSKTHSVSTKNANELGIYDMSGNVWEWCQDRYGSYDMFQHANPIGPKFGSRCVCRGGGWRNGLQGCRVAFRYYNFRGFSDFNLGLRLAHDL